ncbi:stage II sporulation protein M [Proteiniborus ethanoligenes]|uniref:Stage II sporulation protein M n=1 Tax=Proteiniborus ethanoligenes TaxID=415015 RepID=A0A1H3KA34_9FIRM|nr:stage II sporulation protein M [Proteiniborus ethanoligenes]SDY49046.1 stage II sporulation protein M [Proteiniborus ethanoligenes]
MKIKGIIYKDVKENFILYFLLVLALMIGISAGAITISVLSKDQSQSLISFLDSFFKVLNQEKIDSLILLKQSILNNIQTIILVWILGLTVIGAPIVFVIIALRGFIVGFTVGFLINELGFKGFVFSLLTILPQNIFVIPGMIALSVLSINFAIKIITSKRRIGKNSSFLSELTRYSIHASILSLFLFIGSLVEAYITPTFMQLLLGYVL